MMKGFEQVHPSELEENNKVEIESYFEDKSHLGVVESVIHVPGDDAYRLSLDSGRVYTVAENPENFGFRQYVAGFNNLYAEKLFSPVDSAYETAAEILDWEEDDETERHLALTD